MVSKTKKLALQLFAFAAAVFVLLAYMSVFPAMKTYAAGTDLYVGYSGRNNNFSTVQAAVDKEDVYVICRKSTVWRCS